jgi:predicted transcriptional regulator
MSATTSEIAQKLESRARAAGLSVDELCERAKVSRSTFTRMKSGKTTPTLGTLSKLLRVVEEIETRRGIRCESADEILRAVLS